MRLMRAESSVFLLVSFFLLVDVSVSIPLEGEVLPTAATPLLTRSRPVPVPTVPQELRPVVENSVSPNIWTKLKALFNRPQKAKIGEIVQGLKDVKHYLELLGYLNSTLLTLTDLYAQIDQYAIEEFQNNYNLQVTGQPDMNMYNVITEPRCGVPDIINGITTMNSGKAKTTLFTPWWRTGEKELSYALDPANNVTDSVKSLFRDAFNRWSVVTSLNFTETASFNASDIQISFITLDGKGGNVAVAYTNYNLHAGFIYLDSEEEWVLPSQTLSAGEVDLESVAMHEIGHLLGLGHSSVEQAIMYPVVLQEKKIYFTNDDVLRINQIKNPNNNNGLPSLHGTSKSSGGVAGYGTRLNLVFSFVGGFAFMVLGFF